jgi:hypothetical protein
MWLATDSRVDVVGNRTSVVMGLGYCKFENNWLPKETREDARKCDKL